jgi:hypothetical protein
MTQIDREHRMLGRTRVSLDLWFHLKPETGILVK